VQLLCFDELHIQPHMLLNQIKRLGTSLRGRRR